MSPCHADCQIAFHLKSFVRTHNIGKVMTGEVGIFICRNPDSIRAAEKYLV